MEYHWIILEPQMFHCMNFIVYCESKERAISKVKGWCNSKVQAIDKLFEGRIDRDYMVRAERSRWDTGLQNMQYMGLRARTMRQPDHFII